MPTIQWDDSYSVNHHEIDEQHKKWIAIFNEMHNTLMHGAPGELESMGRKALGEMAEYARYHFTFEEDYMKLIDYPGIVEHRRLHKDFDTLLYKYNKNVRERNELVLNTDILKLIKKWLLNHILVEDGKYAKFVASRK